MNQIICQFAPAFLAIVVLQRLWKRPLRGWDFVIPFAIMTGVINMLTLAVIAGLFSHGQDIVNETLFSARVSYRYIALSFVFALLVPHLFEAIRRTIKIELEIKVNPKAIAELLTKEGEEGRNGEEPHE